MKFLLALFLAMPAAAQTMRFDTSGGSVADGSIVTASLADGSVQTAKLGTSAVTSAKLLEGAVTEAKIGALAVTVGKIGTAAVETAKLGTDSVTSAKISAQAVTSAKLGSALTLNGNTTFMSSATIAGGGLVVTNPHLGSAGFGDPKGADIYLQNPDGTGNAKWISFAYSENVAIAAIGAQQTDGGGNMKLIMAVRDDNAGGDLVLTPKIQVWGNAVGLGKNYTIELDSGVIVNSVGVAGNYLVAQATFVVTGGGVVSTPSQPGCTAKLDASYNAGNGFNTATPLYFGTNVNCTQNFHSVSVASDTFTVPAGAGGTYEMGIIPYLVYGAVGDGAVTVYVETNGGNTIPGCIINPVASTDIGADTHACGPYQLDMTAGQTIRFTTQESSTDTIGLHGSALATTQVYIKKIR